MWLQGEGRDRVPDHIRPSMDEKLEKLWKLLSELRREAEYLPVHQLMEQVYDRSGYYDYVSAMSGGETRKANLDMLAEKAAAYEATSYKGLFHFIRYIEKLKRYNTDFGEASSVDEQADTVRIMSIHKSKGLEFPVVFLAGMGKRFNKQDAYAPILMDRIWAWGQTGWIWTAVCGCPTLKKQAIRRRMELEAMGRGTAGSLCSHDQGQREADSHCRGPPPWHPNWKNGRTFLSIRARCLTPFSPPPVPSWTGF